MATQTPQKGPPRGFPDRHPLQRYLPSPVLQRRNDSRLRMHDNGVARSRTGPLSDGSRNGLVHPGGSHRRKNLRNNRSQDTQNPGRGVPGFPAPIQRGRNTLLVCTCGKRQNEPAGRILPGRRRRAGREVPCGIRRQGVLPHEAQTRSSGICFRILRIAGQDHAGRREPAEFRHGTEVPRPPADRRRNGLRRARVRIRTERGQRADLHPALPLPDTFRRRRIHLGSDRASWRS